jgi:hypothetical protein
LGHHNKKPAVRLAHRRVQAGGEAGLFDPAHTHTVAADADMVRFVRFRD